MSVVVAAQTYSKIEMAADRRISSDIKSYTWSNYEKIFAPLDGSHFWVGWTGSLVFGQYIHQFDFSSVLGEEVYDWALQTLVPTLHEQLEKRYMARYDEELGEYSMDGELLLVHDNVLVTVGSDFSVEEHDPMIGVAIGSGSPWAQGSLHTTRDIFEKKMLDREEEWPGYNRAERAVRAANEFSLDCDGLCVMNSYGEVDYLE